MLALGHDACVALLAQHSVGRIAWLGADGPQILPVSYAWIDDGVVFRTSPYGVLSQLVRPTEVAVEIDELDPVHQRGWSVVVEGLAEAVGQPDRLLRWWRIDDVEPWAPGTRNLFLRITPRRISGRRLDAGFGSAATSGEPALAD